MAAQTTDLETELVAAEKAKAELAASAAAATKELAEKAEAALAFVREELREELRDAVEKAEAIQVAKTHADALLDAKETEVARLSETLELTTRRCEAAEAASAAAAERLEASPDVSQAEIAAVARAETLRAAVSDLTQELADTKNALRVLEKEAGEAVEKAKRVDTLEALNLQAEKFVNGFKRNLETANATLLEKQREIQTRTSAFAEERVALELQISERERAVEFTERELSTACAAAEAQKGEIVSVVQAAVTQAVAVKDTEITALRNALKAKDNEQKLEATDESARQAEASRAQISKLEATLAAAVAARDSALSAAQTFSTESTLSLSQATTARETLGAELARVREDADTVSAELKAERDGHSAALARKDEFIAATLLEKDETREKFRKAVEKGKGIQADKVRVELLLGEKTNELAAFAAEMDALRAVKRTTAASVSAEADAHAATVAAKEQLLVAAKDKLTKAVEKGQQFQKDARSFRESLKAKEQETASLAAALEVTRAERDEAVASAAAAKEHILAMDEAAEAAASAKVQLAAPVEANTSADLVAAREDAAAATAALEAYKLETKKRFELETRAALEQATAAVAAAEGKAKRLEADIAALEQAAEEDIDAARRGEKEASDDLLFAAEEVQNLERERHAVERERDALLARLAATAQVAAQAALSEMAVQSGETASAIETEFRAQLLLVERERDALRTQLSAANAAAREAEHRVAAADTAARNDSARSVAAAAADGAVETKRLGAALAEAKKYADAARREADAARADLTTVAAAAEARGLSHAEEIHTLRLESTTPRSPKMPREVVSLTLVAKETSEDVLTLQRRLTETENALAEASSRLVEAFSSAGRHAHDPGSPGPAVLLATESPIPFASPPAATRVSQSTKRANSRPASKGVEFPNPLNPDGTARDLEAALDDSVDKGHTLHGSPPLPFKSWRDSKVLSRGKENGIVKTIGHPCFDASDAAVVSLTKFLRASPTARVAATTYWIVLHVWILFALFAHHRSASGVAEIASGAAP